MCLDHSQQYRIDVRRRLARLPRRPQYKLRVSVFGDAEKFGFGHYGVRYLHDSGKIALGGDQFDFATDATFLPRGRRDSCFGMQFLGLWEINEVCGRIQSQVVMFCLDRIGVGGRNATEDGCVSPELGATEGVGILRWDGLLTAEASGDGWKPSRGGRPEGKLSEGEVWRRNVYVWKSISMDGIDVHVINLITGGKPQER